ncbi:Type I site-specific deoxyribonuclease [Rhodanobacter fulvus Jip2]|uniref:Type I site-specific deoxyribonuclease n=1 Tax=Rhodanobacter fulvus Jip2 TaxID=1163408 RepID=I4VPC7_9GAMM|nr:restriction endonuclease subunit S [Rhodanobacter fulvus]EIL89068.1 Type I site-specific deoxyribonuclease [Rhodanobacter fulvus Jip2]
MSLPRYAQYKDSGVAWPGDVPAHWSVSKVKTVIKAIDSGVSVNAVDTPAADGSAGVLKTSCVYDGTFRFEENKAVLEEELSRVACAVEKDTVIVSRMNTPALVGAAGLVKENRPNIYLPDRLWQIHFHNCVPSFVHYWTLSPVYRHQVEIACAGTSSSMQNLGQDQFKSFWIPLPTLDEQSAIAAFLDRETGKIDALIAEQEKLLTLLAEKRQATISHAVTRGLNPNAPMKDSGVSWLGEVPAHWRVTRLKFVASVQTGIAKGKDNQGKETITVPYLRVANVQDGHLALEQVTTIDIEPEQLDRYRLQVGDVLMNEGGDFDKLGRGAIWGGEIEDCIHQNHVFAVRPHAVSPQWLNQITSSQYAQFHFMGRSKQSTNLASISSTNVMELPILFPPHEEQAAVLAFVECENARLDALHDASTRAISLLKERRSALIAAAVTGKIDVRGAMEAQDDPH